MILEKVHAYDFFLHDDGATSSPGISMLQLYKDASILSNLAHETDDSTEQIRKFIIDTDKIQSRQISVNATAESQPKCVISNNRIDFCNDTSTGAIESIQLESDSGGLKIKGNLTTDKNINAENGTIKCNKLLVKYNGGYVDIIEVFSQMLGVNRTD